MSAAGIAFGALASLVSAAVSAAAVWAVWRLARPLHRGFDSTPWGDPYGGGLYAAALALVGLAVVAALYNLFRRRAGTDNLAAGALLLWALLAVAVAVRLPGGSYLLTWPQLFALAAWAVLLWVGEAESGLRWAALALGAVPVAALFVPLLKQVVVALTLDAAWLAVLPLALAAGMLAPQLQVFAGRRPWLLPAASAGLGVALILGGLAAAAYGGRRKMNNVF